MTSINELDMPLIAIKAILFEDGVLTLVGALGDGESDAGSDAGSVGSGAQS